MIAAMRTPVRAERSAGRAPNTWKSLLEGLEYVRSHQVVLLLLLLALVPMFLGMPYTSLLPIFAGKVSISALVV